jgi:hypothetical protein
MSSDPYPPYPSPAKQPIEQQPWSVQQEAFPSSPPPPKRGRRGSFLIGAGLLLLCILVAVLSHTLLPASAATVTFVARHQSLSQSHTFSMADHTNLTNNQLAAHQITSSTPIRTKKGKTTSTTHQDAIQATGQLVVVAVNATSGGAIDNMIIRTGGIEIDTDEYMSIFLTPNQPTTVKAHIAKAGKAGNIPAYFINANYSPGDDRNLILHVSNPAPFSGGKDSYDGPIAEPADIDLVSNDLKLQLQQEARKNLQKQLRAGEGLLDLQCTPTIQVQPDPHTLSAMITAKGSVTCKGMAYDQQGLQGWIRNDMTQAANKRFGPHLSFVRQIQSDTTLLANSIDISVVSDWAVRLDSTGKLALARAIAGKSQDEAKDMLSQQFSARVTNISLSGWGLHLPTDANVIRFAVDQGARG